jgi:hypothetical protein
MIWPRRLIAAVLLGSGSLGAQEFWVTPSNTNWVTLRYAFPLGSQYNPFDGSTRAKFDAAMGALPPYCRIHLLPGTYQSLGDYGWWPKAGQRISGAGEYLTILQFPPSPNLLTNVYQNTFTMIHAGSQADDHIEIEDLTIDGNYTPGSANTLQAVMLYGAHNRVRRVRCVNQASFTLNHTLYREGFCLYISSPAGDDDPNDSAGNVIEDCDIEDFTCDVGSIPNDLCGLGFLGAANGTIRANRIVQSDPTNHVFAIGPGLYDTLVEGNTLINVDEVFRDDSVYGRTNCTIINNLAKGVTSFADWEANRLGGTYRDVIIANNTVELTNRATFGANTIFLFLPNQQTNHGFMVSGNRVKLRGAPGPINAFIYAFNSQGLVANGNTVDAALTNYFGSGNENLSVHNHDENGNRSGNVQVVTPASLNILH